MRSQLLAVMLASCSREPAPNITLVDAAPDSLCAIAHSTCNPLTQTGCNADEKCTWIIQGLCGAHIGCAAVGASPRGGVCTYDARGADSCAKGDVCVDGVCRMSCDLQGGDPRCAAPDTCAEVEPFSAFGQHVAGACRP